MLKIQEIFEKADFFDKLLRLELNKM